MDYTSLAMYYSAKPVTGIILPTNKLSKVYVPDTMIMYPQLMKFGFWGVTGIKEDFSGFTFIAENDGRINISLAEIPFGRYKLYADMETDTDGADISIWQRQTQISDWLSLNAVKKDYKKHVFLGDLIIDDFKNSVSIAFKTKGNNNKLTLNRLIFEKE